MIREGKPFIKNVPFLLGLFAFEAVVLTAMWTSFYYIF